MIDTETATDDVTDGIAHIEMQRQEAKKESGLAAACRQALRQLQALLNCERAAAQGNDSGAGHSANIAALTIQIEKVKRLASGKSGGRPGETHASPERQQAPLRRAPRTRVRSKGRRTTGRTGGR